MWVVILACLFTRWCRSEGRLSIHSITTQRREVHHWVTVFVTSGLSTAVGDFTATSLNLGYLDSGILFGVVILMPKLAWWKFGLNGIVAFWMAYIVTWPLGASFAEYISRPQSIPGINLGNARIVVVFSLAVRLLVSRLAVSRPDIQERHPLPGSAVDEAPLVAAGGADA